MLAGVGLGEEGLEDLLGGQADLAGDAGGAEVVEIDLVGAKLVGDAEPVEEPGGVGLFSLRQLNATALRVRERSAPCFRVRTWSAMGSASCAR